MRLCFVPDVVWLATKVVAMNIKFLLAIGTAKYVSAAFNESAIDVVYVLSLLVSCNMQLLLSYSFTRHAPARFLERVHLHPNLFLCMLPPLCTQMRKTVLVVAVAAGSASRFLAGAGAACFRRILFVRSRRAGCSSRTPSGFVPSTMRIRACLVIAFLNLKWAESMVRVEFLCQ
jgi:hypothetical protein